MKNKIDKWTTGVRNLKVFVWNCQTLNLQQQNIRDIKINFILEKINDQFPEIIFIIDAGRLLKIGGNYEYFFDGRNILFVRRDLDLKVEKGNNWFEIPNIKLGLVYLVPNNEDKLVEKKILSWELNNWEFAGDFNTKSNKKVKLSWSGGENSLQTGICGKVEGIKIFGSPSDHKLITFVIKRKIKYNSILRVIRIEDKGYKYVEGLLKGMVLDNEIPITKYTVSEIRKIENDEERTILRILNNFRRMRVESLYDKFGWMWRNNRREPFLGTKIPDKVLESFKKELKHDPEKKKEKFLQPIGEIFEDRDIERWISKDKFGNIKQIKIDLPKSGSKALTMESIRLCEIGGTIRKVFKNWIVEGKRDYIKNIQLAIIGAFNKLCEKDLFYCNTFFLKKNEELNSYRDVRLITVVPVLLKVWETLIYWQVIAEANRVMNVDTEYQMGALQGSSTYYAMAALRAKVKKYDAAGIVSLDLVKGYEKVDHNIMELVIRSSRIEDNIKKCLLLWLQMVKNLDYMVNGQIIRTSIGIPMGLSLSPIMFILYLDYGFNGLNKEFLVCYLDDINIIILKQQGNDDFIKEVFARLKGIGMIINDRKSKIFTFEEVISEKRRKDVFSGLINSTSMNFLGRELNWLREGITGEYCDYVEQFKVPRVFPNWLTLAMRRLILIGGICAKHRFITYMWAFKRVNFKANYLKEIFNFLKINFDKFTYYQLILIYPNLLREFIDFTTWNNIGKEYEIALLDLFGDRRWKQMDVEAVKNEVVILLSRKSDEEQNAFLNNQMKLLNQIIEFIKTDMDQIDLKVGRNWDYFTINSFLIIAAQLNGSWLMAKKGLTKAWEIYKRYKMNEWIQERKLERKRVTFDLLNEVRFDFSKFVSYKYFGILLDMMFDRIEYDGDSDWDFFLFGLLEKVWNFVNGKCSYEEFFGKLDYPKFKVISERTFFDRKKLIENLVYGIAAKEKYVFGIGQFDRLAPPESAESIRWKNAKLFVKRFRKIFFALDSTYAKRDLRTKSFGEIVIAFQLKLYASKLSNNEFQKIIIIQDYEELNNLFIEEDDFGDFEIDEEF